MLIIKKISLHLLALLLIGCAQKEVQPFFAKAGVYPYQYQYNLDVATCEDELKNSTMGRPMTFGGILPLMGDQPLVSCMQSKGYQVRSK